MYNDRRRRHNLGPKHYYVEIIVKMLARSAVSRPTANARVTLTVLAHAAYVLALGVRQEHVRGRIDGVGAPLEAPTKSRQRIQVSHFFPCMDRWNYLTPRVASDECRRLELKV